MANEHSYGATLENNKTENRAIQFVLAQNPCLRRPTKEERKQILVILDLAPSFSRAFDLILVPSPGITNILAVSAKDLILVELKTTQKKLLNMPTGFFFGATENEFKLAEKLGDRYKFCFVSLHAESSNYVLLTAKELKEKEKTRRIQYQINL